MAGAEDDRAGEGFLARWSRLKREAREGSAEPAGPPEEAPPAAPRAAEAAAAEEEPIDLSALPKIEDLTPASDITAFLRKGVPAGLRNAALRRMWSLDPAIRDYIGPVDYGWDWNTPGGVPDFVDRIGEGPEIRALAERLFAPAAPPAAPAPPGPAVEEPSAPPRLAPQEPEPERAPEPAPALAGPPVAPVATPTEVPAHDPAAVAAGPPRPAVRPRHGGAMPV